MGYTFESSPDLGVTGLKGVVQHTPTEPSGDGGVRQVNRVITQFPYTLRASDDGETLIFNSADAADVVVPAGLPARFGIGWITIGAGTITFTESGATVSQVDSLFDTGGQNATGALLAGAEADTYVLTGKLA